MADVVEKKLIRTMPYGVEIGDLLVKDETEEGGIMEVLTIWGYSRREGEGIGYFDVWTMDSQHEVIADAEVELGLYTWFKKSTPRGRNPKRIKR